MKQLLLAEFPELEPRTVLAPGAPYLDVEPVLSHEPDSSTSAVTILLTVARIHLRKGQLAVLEALSRLHKVTVKLTSSSWPASTTVAL